MKKVVLLSGGMDSAVLLSLLIDEYDKDKIIALNMYYGQHNDLEIKAAKNIAKHYGVELVSMDLTNVFEDMHSAMLIMHPRATDDFYTPARNSIFLAIAAGIADSLDANEVYYGAHFSDDNTYPDTTERYLRKISNALNEGTRNNIEIRAPFINCNKSLVASLGVNLKTPLELTQSCYMNQSPPCLKCDACILRAKAFKQVGLKDPLLK